MSRRRDDDEPALPAEIPQRRTMYFLLRALTTISTMWPNPFLYRNTAPWLKPIGFRSALSAAMSP